MAVIFETQFENSLDTDWPELAPYDGTLAKRIAGRGIDYGFAYTCSLATLGKLLSSYGATSYVNSTTRIQYGLEWTSGFGDSPLTILTWMDNNALSTGYTTSFTAFLKVKSNGALNLYINSGAFGGTGSLDTDSAAAVITLDGSMHAIQVSFAFTGHTQVAYNVVCNNVSVISGSYTCNAVCFDASCGGFCAMHAWGWDAPDCLERAYITGLHITAHRLGSGFNHMSSFAQVQFEDSVNIITYNPCNAEDASVSSGCSPFVPPLPPTGSLTVGKLTYPLDTVTEFEVVISDGTVPPLSS